MAAPFLHEDRSMAKDRAGDELLRLLGMMDVLLVDIAAKAREVVGERPSPPKEQGR